MPAIAYRKIASGMICLAMLLVLVVPAASWAASSPTNESDYYPFADVTLNTNLPAQYGKLEVSFNLTTNYDNPFDPEEVDVQAVVVRPDGQIEAMPGFYRSDMSPNWAVRYSPRQLGEHAVMLTVSDSSGYAETGFYAFEAVEPDPASRGFLGISGDRFGDSYGNQLTLLGTNFAWGAPDEIKAAMPEYRDSGMNLMRIWLSCWWSNYSPEYGAGISTEQNGIEMIYDGVGRYHLGNMERMDGLMDKARESGIYLMLTMNSFGDFYYDWPYHAYNIANGGPSNWEENNTDFWFNPEAINYQKKLLRYMFARWGYSTSLGMLEYWNEADNRVNVNPDVRDAWHEAVDTYWKSLDFYNHPTTTSFAWQDHAEQHATQRSWQGLHTLDVVNMHTYYDGADVIEHWEKSLNALRTFGNRPIFLGETGKTHSDHSQDADLLNYAHDGVWAPLFRAGAAAANSWWIFEHGFHMPEAFRTHYKLLADFIRPLERHLLHMPFVDYGEQEMDTVAGGFQTADRMIGWIHDKQSPYNVADPRTVEGLTLTIPNMPEGEHYTVAFYDTYTGQWLQRASVPADANGLTLQVPIFSRDIAMQAIRQGSEWNSANERPVAVYVDQTAPSAPTGVTANRRTEASVWLSWTASADDTLVSGYNIYRNGVQISTTTGSAAAYRDYGLEPASSYTYVIRARDAAGHLSAASVPLTVSTMTQDVEVPSAPMALTAPVATVNTVDLAWEAASDNTGVVGYFIYRNGQLVGTTQHTTYQDSGLRRGTAYSYRVAARDASWNVSSLSELIEAQTVQPELSDNLLPNPSFETTSGMMPTDWYCEQAQYCISDESNPRSGDRSFKIEGFTGAWFEAYSATANAVPGKMYALDGFIDIPVNNGGTTHVRLQFFNAGGSLLQTHALKAYSGTTSGYDAVYGEFEAPPLATKVGVNVRIEGLNAEIYLDDFTIVSYGEGDEPIEQPEDPDRNLLLNPAFDERNEAWKTAIWNCEKNWLCSWTDQVTRSGATGTADASMRIYTEEQDWFSISQAVEGEAGAVYTLEGYVLASEVLNGEIQAKLRFLRALSGEDALIREDWIANYSSASSQFVRFEGSFSAPTDTEFVQVWIYANGFEGEAYLEDFALKQVSAEGTP